MTLDASKYIPLLALLFREKSWSSMDYAVVKFDGYQERHYPCTREFSIANLQIARSIWALSIGKVSQANIKP